MELIHSLYKITLTQSQASATNRLVSLSGFKYLYPEVQGICVINYTTDLSFRVGKVAETRLPQIEKSILDTINYSLAQNLIEQKDMSMHVPNQKPRTPLARKLQWK
jgi:hypothetical protein